MDDRQGNIYETREQALAAGVPPDHVHAVEVADDQVLRIASGPFKGRLYMRTATGLRRVRGQAVRLKAKS